ncbi:MAG: arginase, partial [Pseudomonadota bacterium]
MVKECIILGAPVGTGAGQSGCQMGPEAYRTAGL